jgi:ADP-ribose pyrophosphatase YjhB (NUDIX family)
MNEDHGVVGIISRINNNGEFEYLLVSSKTVYKSYEGFYYPPGGHIENNETEEEALVRELKEELGVIAYPVRKLAKTKGDVEGLTVHWWECKIEGQIKFNQDELSDADFFTLNQLEGMNLWPATKDFFNKYIKI